MLELLLFPAIGQQKDTTAIQILQEQTTVQVEEQKIDKPKKKKKKELTVEQKIEKNFYNCDTDTHYIRADNAKCKAKPVRQSYTTQSPVRTAQGGSNTYAYGNCTYYAKNTISWVPNGWGNANQWAYNARRQGYTVSSTPIVGAVAAQGGGRYGHVAVVIGVGGNTVTISEMNYKGFNIVSTRTVPKSSFTYIY